jgi:hypothetical protein
MNSNAFAVALILASLSPVYGQNGRIEEREENRQKRIGQGVASGRMTPAETVRIERTGSPSEPRNPAGARLQQGKLAPTERRQIDARQDQLSREICREKHEAQNRPGSTSGALRA